MEQAQHFLTHFSGPMGYLIFFLLITACGCGLPFNSDISLITASVLAAAGTFNLWILMALAYLAILTGDTVAFFAGRTWGLTLVHRKPFKWIFPPKQVTRAQHYIQHHGSKFIFVVRFLPLIRTALFFTSGTLQVKPTTFYLMDMSSTLVYLPLIMCTSFYASSNIDRILVLIKEFQFGLLGVLLMVFAIIAFKPLKKSVRRS